MNFTKPQGLSRNGAVEMGSARASRAVFRALAEHIGRGISKPLGSISPHGPSSEGAARNTRWRVCSPKRIESFQLRAARPTALSPLRGEGDAFGAFKSFGTTQHLRPL
jgi:hypothetical protein